MTVGMLGDVIFKASDKVVQTLNNAHWSGSANWTTHLRPCGDAITEFTGLNPDSFTFDIYLSCFCGVEDVQEPVNLIWKYEREGVPVPLTLGEKGYGKYRWSILSHDTQMEHFDRDGNLISCTVSVTLQEYLLK